MSKKMERITFDREKVMTERLQLIKQRHKQIILEPRKKSVQSFEPDVFFEEDDHDFYEEFDEIMIDASDEAETELF